MNGNTYFFGHFVSDLDALGLEESFEGLLLFAATAVSERHEINEIMTHRLMLLN